MSSASLCQPDAGRIRLEYWKRQTFAPYCFDCLHHRSHHRFSHASPMFPRLLRIRALVADYGMIYRWTFGSILFLASWAVLMGPVTYAKHLISGPRLPFSAAYFGSIGLTLFFAIKVRPLSALHYHYHVCDYHARLTLFSFHPTSNS